MKDLALAMRTECEYRRRLRSYAYWREAIAEAACAAPGPVQLLLDLGNNSSSVRSVKSCVLNANRRPR
jgi:hypothetical protein